MLSWPSSHCHGPAVGAGLLLRSFQQHSGDRPRFQPEHVLTASLSLRNRSTLRRGKSKLYRQLIARLQQRRQQMAGTPLNYWRQSRMNHIFIRKLSAPPGAQHSTSQPLRDLRSVPADPERAPLRDVTSPKRTTRSTPVLLVSDHCQPLLAESGRNRQAPEVGPPERKIPGLTVVGVLGT